ncbi:type IV pilus biogenesis protein PilM [Desulfosudis oleivorans]|uniref:Type IV pilus assembly protein PilM n=1 Tax=Desulfosudis oleivorans (strain DSM 6200 / JCM 39069 / Hxd3) TaxID=96561 RepID=A8ZSX9_DESOH|nr:type IV pilus assembly protein PilM [Desulfosudis oleivorans]ABW66143.1 type IV pilus assembly protein PilM [Desulfosudis oleivorans Hxd3]
MLFGKKDHLVGLDIGSSVVKVAEVAVSSSGRSLLRFGTLEMPAGAIVEEGIKDPEVVAATIKELFSLYNIKEDRVAISIGGYSVIVKKINVQSMSEEQLQEVIAVEAEQYIPFDINNVNLDFQILGDNDQNPNQIDVMLVAAKKETVNDYLNVIDIAGLTPVIIDVDAFALQNIYEVNYEAEENCVALIDIGANKTSLNILKGSKSVFMRDVSFGCNQINHHIATKINCSLEEAEELKLSDKQERISTDELNSIISSVVSDWTTEIRRALDFFYSTYSNDHLKCIYLSGGGSNIPEFRQMLASQTSSELEILNPFSNFDVKDDRLDSAYLKQIAPQAAICMGIAIRRVDDK